MQPTLVLSLKSGILADRRLREDADSAADDNAPLVSGLIRETAIMARL